MRVSSTFLISGLLPHTTSHDSYVPRKRYHWYHLTRIDAKLQVIVWHDQTKQRATLLVLTCFSEPRDTLEFTTDEYGYALPYENMIVNCKNPDLS